MWGKYYNSIMLNEKGEIAMKLKQKLMLSFCLAIIIPLIVLGFVASRNAIRILETETKNISQTLTAQIEKSLTYEFQNYSKSLAVLSHDGNLDSASYNAMAKDKLLTVFEGYTVEFPDIQNVYVGYANQEFIIYPHVELPADYDPTIRPWYEKAVAEKKVIWTEPYPSATGDAVVITAAAPVYSSYNPNKVIGVLAADINLKTISEEFKSIRVGETGIPVIVDAKGKILIHEDPEQFENELPVPELLQAVQNQETGMLAFEHEGVKQFSIFDTMPDTGWRVLITMDQDEFDRKGAPIRNIILMVGVVSFIVAGIFSNILANRIAKPIQGISQLMDKVKDGDFKVQSKHVGTDEVGDLSKAFNVMVDNVGGLIKNTQSAVTEVKQSSEHLTENAEQASIAAEEVAKTVSEIAEGATEQAMDAEKGTIIASELDTQFVSLSEISMTMSKEAQQAIEKNEAGVKVVTSLKEKTEENNEASQKVSESIGELESKSNAIGSIVETISAISEQTNLLALNASIEAARAGEHGRGFAVVADEIRKLAEESNQAAEEIKNIVGDIQDQSRSTVTIMSDMTDRSEEQAAVVTDVNEAFTSINESINQITGKIGEITTTIDLLSTSKDSMLEAIQGISAVSEETAAGSEEVSASMEEQSATVQQVSSSAVQLNALADELEKQIARFKV